MTQPNTEQGRYATPKGRWQGIGPYYAMFPTAFADNVVEKYTSPGDSVLDPFAGRGTAVFSAAVSGRSALGIDVNPLGHVYANAKLSPGEKSVVKRRLEELVELAPSRGSAADDLPAFYHHCFSRRVREFLVAARARLDWRDDDSDRTLMALTLISLHGKYRQSLSNQMRQSTAMAPAYSVRWWKKKNLAPPDISPLDFLSKRIEWRYARGVPEIENAESLLGDSLKTLPEVVQEIRDGGRPTFRLLLTSPPYHNVTDYYQDQWLRIWMLGGPELPSKRGKRYGEKFVNRDRHGDLLMRVFQSARRALAEDAVIYVRTGGQKTTLNNTKEALAAVFPEWDVEEVAKPVAPGPKVKPYGRGGAPKKPNKEVDLILTRNG